MKCLLLSVVMLLPCVAASVCLRLLRNDRETRILRRKPDYVRRWNAITAEFENLEALTLNNSAFCSVDTVNDLRGKTIVVGIQRSLTPYVIINASTNDVTGFMGDVWKTLEEALKFKTIYKKMESMPVSVLSNAIDEMLIASSMHVFASSYLTYSMPFTTTWYSLFIQPDGAIITTWWYINIFSHGVWAAFFVSIVCVACSIMMVQRVKKFVYADGKDHDDEFSSPLFNVLYALGGTTGQGLQKIPGDWSTRMITLSLLMMGMLLSYGFSSTLTSCLASKGNSVALTDLKDVLTKRTHTLCMRNNSGAYRYFTVDESGESDLQDRWKGLVNQNCPDTNDKELVSKMCRRGFVYLEVPGVFLPVYRTVEHTCEFLQLPDNYWVRKFSLVHSRTAPHRRLIDAYLMRLRSAGILTYLEKKWIHEDFKTPSMHVQSSTFQPVEYVHIRLSIWLLAVMMLVSALVCVLENVWYKLRPEGSQTENRDPGSRAKTYRARSRPKWRGKSTLLLDTDSPVFRRSVAIRINRWRSIKCTWQESYQRHCSQR